MKPVIIVGGEKESGKDTFCDMLATELSRCLRPQTVTEPRIVRFAFADPLKRALGEALGLPDKIMWGPSAVKESAIVYGKSFRHWIQWYGTELFRDQVHPDVWVDAAIRAMVGTPGATSYIDPRSDAFVISDCRFGNEFQKIRDCLDLGQIPVPRGGFGTEEMIAPGTYKCFLFKVWRKNRPTAQADSHRSETSVKELDAFHPSIIDNSGTLDELRERAALEAGIIYRTIQGAAFDAHRL